MKSPSEATRRSVALNSLVRRETPIIETDEEPPSSTDKFRNLEDEPPPSTVISGRYRLFGNVPDSEWNDWRWQFQHRVTTVDQLSAFIPLSRLEKSQISTVTRRYPLSITPYYLSLINPANPGDPVRKQAVPCIQEVTMDNFGEEDPLEEERDSKVPGLVHRYPDRVLMTLTDVCPMLCRHCTRKREWRKGAWVRSDAEIEAMLGYIRNHKEVRDIVVSGGDPLTLATSRIESILSRLRAINHVEIIRIGTRFPVVLPMRIDDELCNVLSKYGPIWVNTHFNHYNEITPEAARACDKLLRAGVPVNNQTVLMRGINDSVEIQTKLCQGLLRSKVRPYYLFQCDEVQGTEHFRTPVEVGIKIIDGMRGHTSGLAVPNFVIDLPNGGGKIPLQPNYVLMQNREELVVRNYARHIFQYRNPGVEYPETAQDDMALIPSSYEVVLADGR